ncbi:histidine phosphatase family protein [Magnetospirillum sp. UT-4]|uniref:SixA phosphatase family protein n=1 Tax=Magnetospirillum sp. UT-4 TaxID=2681467 RepID=UPI00138330C1|nr:histidine phosphatase family protein [Magnetospirillum sp. UT-4]CAA7627200.1 putative phosphohistidine phosphatase [Magnetospirillum sp. UT-4]
MRTLYLLRHAKSSWDDPAADDFDRPLNGRGRRAAQRMAQYLTERRICPALVLCSAAARTRATYDLLGAALAGAPVSFEQGLYEASLQDLSARLRRVEDGIASVMVIGHNPGMERLGAFLAGGGEAAALERLRTKYPTCTLAVLETGIARWSGIDQGDFRLAAFIRPRDLDKDLGAEED